MSVRRVVWFIMIVGLISVAVVLTTVVLPGRGPELARRLDHEWSFGELELSDPTRVDFRTISFPLVRLLASDSSCIIDAKAVRWRRPGVLPTREGLSIVDSEFEFATARLDVVRNERGRWNLEGLGDFAGLPGRVAGSKLWVGLKAAERFIEIEVLSPTLRRRGTAFEFTGSVSGSSWSEGAIVAKHSPDAWSLDLDLDDVDATRFPFDMASSISEPWPRAVQWQRGRLDVDWELSSARQRVVAECYQATIGLPESMTAEALRFVRGGGSIEGGVVTWRLDRATFSRSEVSGKGELGLQESSAEIQFRNIARDRGLTELLPPFWKQLAAGVPWSGGVDLDVTFGGPRGSSLGALVREAVVHLKALSPRGTEQVNSIHGQATIRPDGASWRVDLRGEESTLHGLTLPAMTLTGLLSATNLELDSSESGLRIKLFEWDPERGDFRAYAECGSLPMGPMFGLDLGRASWELNEFDASWKRDFGWSWDARLAVQHLQLPEATAWPWRDAERRPLDGIVVLSGRRGGVKISYLSLDDGKSRWEIAGDLDPDGECRLEGFRVPLQRMRFQPHIIPLDGATAFEIRGPVFAWEVR